MNEKTEEKGNRKMNSMFLENKWKKSVTDEKIIKCAQEFCEGYKEFLNQAKTEREAVEVVEKILLEHGFKQFSEEESLNPGDRIYTIHRNKAISIAVIGKKGMKEGIRMAASHLDSPRIDAKPNPLYESGKLGYMKTHYYGLVRRYQWVTIPLALHGVVAKKDGTVVKICIGEKEGEPTFCISDLLPHLSRGLPDEPINAVITGEHMNVLTGSLATKDETGQLSIKNKVLQLLGEMYGMEEEDFCSSELCFVPAYPAADVGFDRSMIGAYGQDDKVCAYPSLMALFDQKIPENTCMLILADKEEIGNHSTTGMDSKYFDYFVEDLAKKEQIALRDVFRRSIAISTDVSSMFDPDYAQAFDEKNVGYINGGAILQKYSGKLGKSETSDANAEFLGWLRNAFATQDVLWQIGEIGKVDLGGGGTLSKPIADRDIEVADFGVPLLSMHSPYEVTGKNDIYMLYKGVKGFFEAERQGRKS